MNSLLSEDAFFIASVMMTAGVVGVIVGFRGGRRGRGLGRTIGHSVLGHGLASFVITSILAVLIAAPEMREASERYSRGLASHPETCLCVTCTSGLLVSQPSPPIWDPETGREMMIFTSPWALMAPAFDRGAVWGFLVPSFWLFGAIPAGFAGFVAYTFGTSARVRAGGWRDGAMPTTGHPATPKSPLPPDT